VQHRFGNALALLCYSFCSVWTYGKLIMRSKRDLRMSGCPFNGPYRYGTAQEVVGGLRSSPFRWFLLFAPTTFRQRKREEQHEGICTFINDERVSESMIARRFASSAKRPRQVRRLIRRATSSTTPWPFRCSLTEAPYQKTASCPHTIYRTRPSARSDRPSTSLPCT
jgi:hypothetical protein